MMKCYFITFAVLLVVISKHVIFSNKTDTALIVDKFSLHSNDESLEHTELKESTSSKTEVLLDANVIPTTYRSVRLNSSSSTAQERDTKLMNLLAARRSALHRDRFRTHRRIVTTGRTKPPIETTSKTPPDLRTICVRNCTKNFTRRTTASCMRQCTSIQRQGNTPSATNFTSEEEKSQKDNNEILFTDESSHGFFIVAKDVNDTMNHIPELGKTTGISSGSVYKARPRNKPSAPLQVSDADSYLFFGRKIPSLRPSFLSISTVSDEHPQVIEVSVSQKPLRPKSSNKFNTRDRNISPLTRKLSAGKLLPLVVPVAKPVIEDTSLEDEETSNPSMEKTFNADLYKEIETTTSKEAAIFIEDITPSLLVEGAQYSTESTQTDFSTPLIISVIDEEETTITTEPDYLTEANGSNNDDLSTEFTKIPIEAPSHFSEDKTNLIIFVNKSMDVVAPTSIRVFSPSQGPVNATDGLTVVKTTILSSVRSTVYPPNSSNKTSYATEATLSYPVDYSNNSHPTLPSYENVESTKSSLPEDTRETKTSLSEEREMTPDTRRLNIATYVLAGLGMFPVLIVILYLAKSLILRRYSKHDEDFDVCITDQQPISPVKKIEKYDEEDESGQYEQCSISSMDEFNRANLRLKTLLGEGNFGKVWKAEADDLCGHIGATRIVAVKTVRSGSAQDGLKEEATIMRKLGSHTNVVTLLGACIESEPHMLIMEFAMRGRLLSLLRAARSATNILPASVPGGRSLAPLSPRTLAGFALDIAAGMEYVAGKRIVHRDLAARNVLIDHNGICKICDFGMSIDLDAVRKKRDKQYSVDIMGKNSSKFDKFKFDIGERFINHWSHGFSSHNVKKPHDTLGRRPALPIRWMAPESLQYNEFSTETDVWAFGIVLWEIATLGATPYSNLSGREVVRHVLQGTRPELPKDGRHGFFDLMSLCWHKVPDLRPTFREARLEISRSVCKWMDDDAATSDYMDVSGFSEDLEHGMVYFNQRISEFECEI